MPSGHPSHRDDNRHAASQETPPPLGDELQRNIFGHVVAETASSLAQAEEAVPELKAAMVAVARRFAGQPITVDPIGTALLESLLRVQFAFLAERPALLTKTARTVAASLLADPAARLRVEHLWAKLSEEAA
jgi:hypothetical protein